MSKLVKRTKKMTDIAGTSSGRESPDKTYGNVKAPNKPPAVPPKAGNEEDWDILQGFLKISVLEKNCISKDQIDIINPSDKKMVRAAVVGRVKKTNFDATRILVKLMAYEGFNPVVVISEMTKMTVKWNESTHPLIWKLTLDGFSFEVTEDADLAKDVLFLTTLFLTRGNNLRKILTTIDKQVKEALQVKIKTYKIKSDTDEDASKRKRNEKVEMSSKELTLSRIRASFPHIALAVVVNTGVRGKVDLLCMGLQYKIDYGESSDPPCHLNPWIDSCSDS